LSQARARAEAAGVRLGRWPRRSRTGLRPWVAPAARRFIRREWKLAAALHRLRHGSAENLLTRGQDLKHPIEVVFATHNGARTLPRMIAAMEQVEPPSRGWRLIAVDNASTDHSRDMLEGARDRLPIEILSCPTPGKMPAILTALAVTASDLVVFTDDDVEPDRQWLRAYEQAASDNPQTDVFGGPITPEPLEPLTAWFEVSHPAHAELFAKTDGVSGPADTLPNFFGPNFMLRRRCLEIYHEVPASLGPSFQGRAARTFAMGEDTAIMEIAWRRGYLAQGVPDAGVKHLVRRHQTELTEMLERAERHGRGWAVRRLERGRFTAAIRLELIARGLAAKALASAAGTKPDTETFMSLWRAHWQIGAAKTAGFQLAGGRARPAGRPANLGAAQGEITSA
jgi:cellulose synthase/poly-beta-1,6-N-acetylglucosamine synthase-like glycosyltransferase